MTLRKKLYWALRRFMLDHFHSKVVDRDWLRWKGYPIDWEHPRDINEKIQWLMCFSDTSLWSVCADKYRVRDFVKSRGLEEILVPLLGVWDKAEDIGFDSLPEKFVIKCNHDSGSYHIVDKSKGFNPDALRKDLSEHLKVKYGYRHGEMYYNRIKPCVLAERYLQGDTESPDGSLVDYKVWCFDGKPYSVLVCYDRTADGTFVNLYDLDWKAHPEVSVFTEHYRDGNGKVPRPLCLERILSAAAVLSKGFPEVRADFYQVERKLYFGELTFSSLCGKMNYFTDDYLKELGRQCVLPEKKK